MRRSKKTGWRMRRIDRAPLFMIVGWGACLLRQVLLAWGVRFFAPAPWRRTRSWPVDFAPIGVAACSILWPTLTPERLLQTTALLAAVRLITGLMGGHPEPFTHRIDLFRSKLMSPAHGVSILAVVLFCRSALPDLNWQRLFASLAWAWIMALCRV